MLFDPDNTTFYMIAGIVVITASLLLHQFNRRKRELEQQTKHRKVVEAAQETERKRQLQMGKSVKTKLEKSYSTAPERVPLPDLSDKQFTGAYSPRNIAKWEAEIHQIGRQMIGTLDSKMVAIQTLTQEANRVANRMELLLERFEELAKTQFNPKSQQNEEQSQPPFNEEQSPQKIPENLPNLIPAGSTELPATSLVLNNLQPEHYQQTNTNETLETIPHATILKIEEPKKEIKPEKWSHSTKSLGQRLPPTISLSTNNPLSLGSLGLPEEKLEKKSSEIETEKETNSSYDEKTIYSPELTNNTFRNEIAENIAQIKPLQKPDNLSLGSLYDDELAEREHRKVFAVAASAPANPQPTNNSSPDLQKQIEMLNNYGYTSRQIAQSLNITVGEVDLLLKLKEKK
jgi:hypothetical protein